MKIDSLTQATRRSLIVVAILILTACGGGEDKPSATDKTPKAAAPPQPVTLDPDKGYVHPHSGVGFVYPGDPWRNGKPSGAGPLYGVRLTPLNDRFGDDMRVYARWLAHADAPASAGNEWLYASLNGTYYGFATKVTDLGTYQAAGVTWRVMGTYSEADGGIPEEWQRMYVHAVRRDGVLYGVELRITTTEEGRLKEGVPLLDQFRFAK